MSITSVCRRSVRSMCAVKRDRPAIAGQERRPEDRARCRTAQLPSEATRARSESQQGQGGWGVGALPPIRRAGHGRVVVTKLIGMAQVPVLCLGEMSPAERKAYAPADNKLALNAGWDQELLALELQELIDCDFSVELTGFSLAEIDFTLGGAEVE